MPAFESEQIEDFHRDGYLLVRGLFTDEEIRLVGETARNDHAMDQASSLMDDGDGHDVRLSLWNHPGDGIYGMVARCRRVVDGVEELLGDEVDDAGVLETGRDDARSSSVAFADLVADDKSAKSLEGTNE